MLLEHQGLDAAADRLRTAVEAVYAAGEPLTPDQGGSASTEEFAAAVEERL
jgi:isocitrate/isopropylmalate dehydrogenase